MDASRHTRLTRQRKRVGKAGDDQRQYLRRRQRGQARPHARRTTGMHQQGTGTLLGENGGHLSIPKQAGDIVDDLRAFAERGTRRGRMVGIDRDDSLRTRLQQGPQHGQDARLLFGRIDGRCVGPGGFPAKIEQVGALIEQCERVVEGVRRGEIALPIGKAVRGNVEDTHEQSAAAQREAAMAKAPRESGTSQHR